MNIATHLLPPSLWFRADLLSQNVTRACINKHSLFQRTRTDILKCIQIKQVILGFMFYLWGHKHLFMYANKTVKYDLKKRTKIAKRKEKEKAQGRGSKAFKCVWSCTGLTPYRAIIFACDQLFMQREARGSGVTFVNIGFPCWVTMVHWSQSRVMQELWKDSLECLRM